MSNMVKLSHSELVMAAAGPRRWNENWKSLYARLGRESGYAASTIEKFRHGEFSSRPLAARLQAMAAQAEALAGARSDPELSMSYSSLARSFHRMAGK